MMASYSGLDRTNRIRCRDRVVTAALLAYRNRASVHYTRGSARWQGISRKRNARLGQYPSYADCSAFATWCLWNGLYLGFGKRDIVNGASWTGGFTGTLLSRGKLVRDRRNMLRGDLVFYGRGWPGNHVAIVVAVKNGVAYVVSHGSEGGPYYLRWNYRSDVMCVRRYI
jgi:hypothetical protein